MEVGVRVLGHVVVEHDVDLDHLYEQQDRKPNYQLISEALNPRMFYVGPDGQKSLLEIALTSNS